MAFCPSCGTPTIAGAAHCGNCGAALPVAYGPPPAAVAPPTVAPAIAAPPIAVAPVALAARKARPTGVTVLAVIQWLWAALLVFYAVIAFVGGSFIADILDDPAARDPSMTDEEYAQFRAMIGPIFVVLGVFCLALAGLATWVGWGMWVGKNWARITHMVLAGIGGGFTAIAALAAMVVSPPLGLVYLLFVAYDVLILWYLTRPAVKEYYVPAAPATPSGPTW